MFIRCSYVIYEKGRTFISPDERDYMHPASGHNRAVATETELIH